MDKEIQDPFLPEGGTHKMLGALESYHRDWHASLDVCLLSKREGCSHCTKRTIYIFLGIECVLAPVIQCQMDFKRQDQI